MSMNKLPPATLTRDVGQVIDGLRSFTDQAHKSKYLSGGVTTSEHGFKPQGAKGPARAIYLTAQGRTHPLRSAWDRLTGRRATQSAAARAGLEAIVNAVRKSGLAGAGVDDAIQGISDLLKSPANGAGGQLAKHQEERFRLEDLAPHFKILVEAHDQSARDAQSKQAAAEKAATLQSLTKSIPAAQRGELATKFVDILDPRRMERDGKAGLTHVFEDLNASWNHFQRPDPAGARKPPNARLIAPDANSGPGRAVKSMIEGSQMATSYAALTHDKEAYSKLCATTNRFILRKAQVPGAVPAHHARDATATSGSNFLNNVTAYLGGSPRTILNAAGAMVSMASEPKDENFRNICEELLLAHDGAIKNIEFAAKVLSDPTYLTEVGKISTAQRDLLAQCGAGLTQLAAAYRDPENPIHAAVEFAAHAVAAPADFRAHLALGITGSLGPPPPMDVPPPPDQLISAPPTTNPPPLPQRPGAGG